MTSREIVARRALRTLGADRFVSFVRAIRDTEECLAARQLNDELDSGATVDAILFSGKKFGYHLCVRPTGARRFRIEFGCQAGPLAGDGGTWQVEFAPDGSVVRAE